MAEEIACPSCSRTLTAGVPLGTLVQCPLCEHRFRVGDEAPADPRPDGNSLVAASLPATREDDVPEDEEPYDEEEPLPESTALLGRTPTLWLTGLLCGQLVLLGLHLFLTLMRDGRPPNLRAGDPLYACVLLLWWAAGFALLWWVARVVANLPLLAAEGCTLNPSGAVIALLLPLFNLACLPHIFNELWRSSDPHAIDDPQQWKQSPGSPLVHLWLGSVYLAAVLSVWRYFDTPDFGEGLGGMRFWRDFGETITFSLHHVWWFSAILQLYMVRQIMQRQLQRQANLFARAAAADLPDETNDSYGEEETPPQA